MTDQYTTSAADERAALLARMGGADACLLTTYSRDTGRAHEVPMRYA
ncbi:MAG: hypothetical protein IVW57_08450, partial [Ktedonobacterales bacterium]|nr:hypothetical protein [Ktedonobacterales bacterium]